MSLYTVNDASYNYFRRRALGRAASPPTFTCYEQRRSPYEDDEECSDNSYNSCSEDEDDYNDGGNESSSDDEVDAVGHHDNGATDNMDMDEVKDNKEGDDEVAKKVVSHKKDVKGKQKAVEVEPRSPKRRHRKREPVYTLRPILTIHKSDGFVWNQVCDKIRRSSQY